MKTTAIVPKAGNRTAYDAEKTATSIASQVFRRKFKCEIVADRPAGWHVVLVAIEKPMERVRLRTRILHRIFSPFRDIYCECRARMTWDNKA